MSNKFTKNLSFDQIDRILKESQKESFEATPQNALASSLSKGIYFWYIEPDGIQFLSQYLESPIILESSVHKINNKVLIYLGTAGTRPTENNIGHIRQRLLWHISTKHRPSAIKNGTLSTLRTTIGALLNDHLISSNGLGTETLINNFMRSYLSVTYIEYQGDAKDVMKSINEDEKLLIIYLKPLLNIKNNPNAVLIGHPTKAIKERRRLINKNSKKSLEV